MKEEKIKFYKRFPDDKVWWVDPGGYYDVLQFSFDKKKIYKLRKDYPSALTKEELEIFNAENEYWVEEFGLKDK